MAKLYFLGGVMILMKDCISDSISAVCDADSVLITVTHACTLTRLLRMMFIWIQFWCFWSRLNIDLPSFRIVDTHDLIDLIVRTAL